MGCSKYPNEHIHACKPVTCDSHVMETLLFYSMLARMPQFIDFVGLGALMILDCKGLIKTAS